jgi:hypothetical protein
LGNMKNFLNDKFDIHHCIILNYWAEYKET